MTQVRMFNHREHRDFTQRTQSQIIYCRIEYSKFRNYYFYSVYFVMISVLSVVKLSEVYKLFMILDNCFVSVCREKF